MNLPPVGNKPINGWNEPADFWGPMDGAAVYVAAGGGATPSPSPNPILSPGAVSTPVGYTCGQSPGTQQTGWATGASCSYATVTAANTDPITVYFAVTTPASPTCFVGLTGGLPELVFPGGAAAAPFANNWVTDHCVVVQEAWASNPMNTSTPGPNGAMSTGGARQAAAMLYALNNFNPGSLPTAWFGFSEGSSLLWYAVVDYDLGADLTAGMFSASTPWGDHVGLCTTTAQRTILPWANGILHQVPPGGMPAAPLGIPTGTNFINTSDGTTGCGAASGWSQSDLNKWAAATISNPNIGTYNWPMLVGMFLCTDYNLTAGAGVPEDMNVPSANWGILEGNWSGAASDPCSSETYYPVGSSGSAEYEEMRYWVECALGNTGVCGKT